MSKSEMGPSITTGGGMVSLCLRPGKVGEPKEVVRDWFVWYDAAGNVAEIRMVRAEKVFPGPILALLPGDGGGGEED